MRCRQDVSDQAAQVLNRLCHLPDEPHQDVGCLEDHSSLSRKGMSDEYQKENIQYLPTFDGFQSLA